MTNRGGILKQPGRRGHLLIFTIAMQTCLAIFYISGSMISCRHLGNIFSILLLHVFVSSKPCRLLTTY